MSKRALIIDHSESFTKIVSKLLENMKLTVITAKTVEEAEKEIYQNMDISIIICEHRKMSIDSLKFLESIDNKAFKHIPKLIISSDDDPYLRQAAKEKGAAGWIVKPFDEDQFLQIVSELQMFA